jgi:hypothetical protein
MQMPRSPYARRLDDLARQRSATFALPRNIAFDRAEAGHAARARRALAVALCAGIRPDDAYPAVFRNLAGLGLVIRPIHFMPAWVPALIGAIYGGLVLGAGFTLVEALSGAFPILTTVTNWSWAGTGFGACALGLLSAVSIRMQAARARLPTWSEI